MRLERTAGAVERSWPGSVRQHGAAFKTGPLLVPAAQVPQTRSADGIFMPQLMNAA